MCSTASIVLTWCFPDEESRKAGEISERIALGDKPAVTSFWRHEVLNAFLMGEKRKRLTSELVKTFIEDLARLPIEVDAPESGDRVSGNARPLPQTWPDSI